MIITELVTYNISDRWKWSFYGSRIEGIYLRFDGYNKLFKRPVNLSDFGRVHIERRGELLLNASIDHIFNLNILNGEMNDKQFQSNWGLFKSSRNYHLFVELSPITFRSFYDVEVSFIPHKWLLEKSIINESKVVLLTKK